MRLIPCLLAVLALAACGDDSGPDSDTTVATATTVETTTTTESDVDLAEKMDVFARAACLRFDTDGTSDAVADEVVAAVEDALEPYEGEARQEARNLFFVSFIDLCSDHAIPYGQAQQRAGVL